MHKFKRRMIEKAIEVDSMLTIDAKHAFELLNANELVLGIWQDTAQVDGFGVLVLKGEHLLARVANSDGTTNISWTVIPCSAPAHAKSWKKIAEGKSLSADEQAHLE